MDLQPKPHRSEDLPPRFQPYEVVCLDHTNARLYAEVVQVITAKNACWVRPLVLLRRSADCCAPFEDFAHSANLDSFTLHDLRQGAHLVWPTVLFRESLDTEVLPLLCKVYSSDPSLAEKAEKAGMANEQLNQFVREIWQAHIEVFMLRSTS